MGCYRELGSAEGLYSCKCFGRFDVFVAYVALEAGTKTSIEEHDSMSSHVDAMR